MDKTNGFSTYLYTYYMQFLPYAISANGKKALVAGLGIGIIPKWLEGKGFDVDVVEINPHIYEVAKTYFDFDIKGKVIVADARQHMLQTKEKYDYVITDVFTGGMMPDHLFSIEAIRTIKKRLNKNGILITNIIVNLKDDRFMTNSVIKTIARVFDTVETYPTFAPSNKNGRGNFIIIAHDGAPVQKDIESVKYLKKPSYFKKTIENNLFRKFRFPENEPFIILSDDYNPSDYFYRRLKENFRMSTLRSIDLGILAGGRVH